MLHDEPTLHEALTPDSMHTVREGSSDGESEGGGEKRGGEERVGEGEEGEAEGSTRRLRIGREAYAANMHLDLFDNWILSVAGTQRAVLVGPHEQAY